MTPHESEAGRLVPGALYGLGVGPGDPELITIKALRLLRQADVLAFPGEDAAHSAAFSIALAAAPDIQDKPLLPLPTPMTRDEARLLAARQSAAERVRALLSEGKTVAFLTLGDPSLYSTFASLSALVSQAGHPVFAAAGVPSFCAAAARLNTPISQGDEPVSVWPGEDFDLTRPGAHILMKCSRRMSRIKEALRLSGRQAYLIENCGMEGERVYTGPDAMPDAVGYFSLIIVK